MNEYYILQGKEVIPSNDIHEWGKMLENIDGRRVASDIIGEVIISTVFLGISHQYKHGPPLLFETMIFGGEHDQYQERYSTWEEAERGHEKAKRIVLNLAF